MGFCRQLVSASRVGRRRAADPELYGFRNGLRTDVITVNNRSINMFTAGLNYKFGGWWGIRAKTP